tara:strand:- start:542 stop:1129 length:588 start_codon:yes stop_codon:yes gene_type:complete
MPERNPFEETRQAAQDWSPREQYISRSNQDKIMPSAAKQAFGGEKEGINWRNYIGPDIRVGGGPGIGNIERANMNIPWRMPPGPGEGRMIPKDPSLPPWHRGNLGGGEGSFWNVRADQPWQDSGVMLAMANSPAVNKMKNIYNQVDPFFPDVDPIDQQIGYDFNKNLWGGTLGFGGGYDINDDDYNAYINWSRGL